MASRDAGFLYLERPHALLHIGCVAVLEGRLDVRSLARHVEARLPRLPRYAQRAVGVPLATAHPVWRDDPHFDVRDHVRRWAVPAPGGEAELLETVATLLSQPLDRGRPLWEMHLLEGLHGDATALFQKVHHCMIDGMAGAQLLDALLDAEARVGDRPAPRPPADALPAPPSLVGVALSDAAARAVRGAAGLLRALTRPAAARTSVARLRDAAWSALHLATGDVPELPWNAPIGPRRRLAVTRLPLEQVRRVRRLRGGTVNDVVLSVLAGGLRRYVESQGIPARALELTALVPVSLRSAEEARTLGNRISALLVPLAVDVREEVPRLAATRAVTERLKQHAAWTGIDALLALADELPPPLVAFVGRRLGIGRLANVIATNVPGPPETRWLCGRRVEAIHPIVPIIDGIGLGIAVFSYAGFLHVGLNADADLVPDLDKLRSGIETAFAELTRGA